MGLGQQTLAASLCIRLSTFLIRLYLLALTRTTDRQIHVCSRTGRGWLGPAPDFDEGKADLPTYSTIGLGEADLE
ncbi:hypothetical protein ACRALDRAFT_1061086 [Sodiomyces alcalophilus JCM 7366]|uniref:uncharacterized protein n=1 Tax=Sodiomyces alcalophilus JCM 7366 TaxID=591952 RepID=UPI0039B4D479